MSELKKPKWDYNISESKRTKIIPIPYFQEVSLPKIALPGQGRDNMQDIDSDQESIRNMCLDNRRGQAKIRRHTLPPILPETDL